MDFMRKIKKLIVAVMAMALALGMLTMTASAAEDTYNVAGAEALCGVNWDPSANQMEKQDDGTWVKEFTNIKAGSYEFKIATNGAWNNGEYNLEGDASSGGANATVTVEKDGSTVVVSFDGTKASVEVKTGTDAGAGVSTPVVAVAVVAVIALAGAAICMKKRTVTE